jgi:hypothetical protein
MLNSTGHAQADRNNAVTTNQRRTGARHRDAVQPLALRKSVRDRHNCAASAISCALALSPATLADGAAETQAILQQAYEKKLLRGHKLIAARRLIEQRQRRGKGRKINGSQSGKRRERPLSSNALIRAYQEDVDRKRILIRKAETTRNRLIFVTEAIRKLIVDENFVTLLRAEGIETLPRNLAARIEAGVKA